MNAPTNDRSNACGIYVHVPFCRSLCPYCDFAVHVTKNIPHQAYLAALRRELLTRRSEMRERTAVSIYFGGGTPSLWSTDCLREMVAAIREQFVVSADAEVTIEANPIDVTEENIAAWLVAGITRVSLGIQSLSTDVLQALGRRDHHGDGRLALQRLAQTPLRVSADLMWGIPKQGHDVSAHQLYDAVWNDIAEITPYVGHISAYELTIETTTRLGSLVRQRRYEPAHEDDLAAMYERVEQSLGAAGFAHYEISSYCRPGQEAIHNGLYWTGVPYLGLGAGASSLEVLPPDENAGHERCRRRTNIRSTVAYLKAEGAAAVAEIQSVGADEFARECIWLGLRTQTGVAQATVATYPGLADKLLEQGLAVAAGDRLIPTLRGFLFANEVSRLVVSAPDARTQMAPHG